MFSGNLWDEGKNEWRTHNKEIITAHTLSTPSLAKFILLTPLLRPSVLVGRYDIDKTRLVFFTFTLINTKLSHTNTCIHWHWHTHIHMICLNDYRCFHMYAVLSFTLYFCVCVCLLSSMWLGYTANSKIDSIDITNIDNQAKSQNIEQNQYKHYEINVRTATAVIGSNREKKLN